MTVVPAYGSWPPSLDDPALVAHCSHCLGFRRRVKQARDLLRIQGEDRGSRPRQALLLSAVSILHYVTREIRQDVNETPRMRLVHFLDHRPPQRGGFPVRHEPDRQGTKESFHGLTDGLFPFLRVTRNAFQHNPAAPQTPQVQPIEMTIDFREGTSSWDEKDPHVGIHPRIFERFDKSYAPGDDTQEAFSEYWRIHDRSLERAASTALREVNSLVDTYTRRNGG